MLVSARHCLGLGESVRLGDQNPCLSDILIFGAAGTVLNSPSQALLLGLIWSSDNVSWERLAGL